jgi:hypothetical protein
MIGGVRMKKTELVDALYALTERCKANQVLQQLFSALTRVLSLDEGGISMDDLLE